METPDTSRQFEAQAVLFDFQRYNDLDSLFVI